MFTPRQTSAAVGISLAAALLTACGKDDNGGVVVNDEPANDPPIVTEPVNPDVTVTTDLPSGSSARSDHGDLTVTVNQTGSDITLSAPEGDLSAPTLSGDNVVVNAETGTIAETTGNNATMTFGDSATVHFAAGHGNTITAGIQPSHHLDMSDVDSAVDSFFAACTLNVGGATGTGNTFDATCVNGNGTANFSDITAGTTVENVANVFAQRSVSCDSVIAGQDVDLTIGLESQGTTRYVINNPDSKTMREVAPEVPCFGHY